MQYIKKYWGWVTALLLGILGLNIYFFWTGCRFLGLTVMGLCALTVLFLLLHMLQKRWPLPGNILLWCLRALVCAGLICAAWAGWRIADAARGDLQTPCQYMIVLGAGVNGTTPSRSLQDRIEAAYAYLSDNTSVQCVVSGGQGEGEDISEARCMYDALCRKGIDPERIWLEEQSTSTRENIAFSVQIIEDMTGQRPTAVGILSSEYHLYRAGGFAREQGLTPVGIPAQTQWKVLFASYFIREIVAVWFYIVFG